MRRACAVSAGLAEILEVSGTMLGACGDSSGDIAVENSKGCLDR
jgi:hypothetical protein